MRWNARTTALTVAVLLPLGLVLIWVARDLRREEPGMLLTGGVPLQESSLHPDVKAANEVVRAGELEKARELLARVPESDPSYTVALLRLGEVNERMGETDEAILAYRRLAAAQPDNPEPFLRLGWVRFRQGKYGEAEFSALRALEISPSNLEARYGVALFRVAGGQVADGVRAYARAVEMDRERRLAPTAENTLQEIARESPELAGVHYAIAFFASMRGDRKREVEALERFLALEPDGPVADNARARLADARKAMGPAGDPGRPAGEME